jgi:transposase
MQKTLYIGLDVHKESISVSAAEEGRNGPVEFLGPISNNPTDLGKLANRLAKNGHRLEFCYEAGCCGYVIYRQLIELGHGCTVAAPSRIPSRPADRIKTDRRDSEKLAMLHRSGDLTAVWVPDEVHEAMRDLVRARTDASMQLMRARQQLLAFLLRHGKTYSAGNHWTGKHRLWLARQTFEQPVHQIVFQDYLEAVLTAAERKEQLMGRIIAMLPGWSMAPVVESLCGLRGIDVISAVTFAGSPPSPKASAGTPKGDTPKDSRKLESGDSGSRSPVRLGFPLTQAMRGMRCIAYRPAGADALKARFSVPGGRRKICPGSAGLYP